MFFIIVALIYLILIFYIHKYLLNNQKDDIDNDDKADNHVSRIELEEFINSI